MADRFANGAPKKPYLTKNGCCFDSAQGLPPGKEGTQELTPTPPPLNLQWHWRALKKNWTEAEPRSFHVRKGFYLNGGQLTLSSSPPISLSISVTEDKVPFIKVPCREGGGGLWYLYTHLLQRAAFSAM